MWPFADSKATLQEALWGDPKGKCNTTKLMVKVNEFIRKKEDKMEKKTQKRLKRQKKEYEKQLKGVRKLCKKSRGLVDLDDSSLGDIGDLDDSSSISDSSELTDDSDLRRELRRERARSRGKALELYGTRRHSVGRKRTDLELYGTRRHSSRLGHYKNVKVVFALERSNRLSRSTLRPSGATLEAQRQMRARAEKIMSEMKKYVSSVSDVRSSVLSNSVTVTAKVLGTKEAIAQAISAFSLGVTIAGQYKFTSKKASIS
jgi:hypothetical protein